MLATPQPRCQRRNAEAFGPIPAAPAKDRRSARSERRISGSPRVAGPAGAVRRAPVSLAIRPRRRGGHGPCDRAGMTTGSFDALDIAALIERYDRPGPRYTSYPTAVEFHAGFGADDYRARLAAAAGARDEPLSLYVHLPFCESRCAYCGCAVVATRKREVAATYLDYLEREIAMLAAALGGRRRVVQYHWGGGTPTYLSTGADRAPRRDRPAALRRGARRRTRDRDRSARDDARADHAAPPPRVQPAVLRRAGLHAGGPGGDPAAPDRGGDARSVLDGARGGIRLDQLRSGLRPAAADGPVLRATRSSGSSTCGRIGSRSIPTRTSRGCARTRRRSIRWTCPMRRSSGSCSGPPSRS